MVQPRATGLIKKSREIARYFCSLAEGERGLIRLGRLSAVEFMSGKAGMDAMLIKCMLSCGDLINIDLFNW